eukprot:TRINITY_DN3335_c0_g1_i1.p1 TRINITY_DN3335_c0_g1~~TRINITY_DN3335_c0_g1_i1.p1  ORF type:complete len:349 (-),score=69.79 TRINITY_DN3335_c0_g1_i1:312-1358(-)
MSWFGSSSKPSKDPKYQVTNYSNKNIGVFGAPISRDGDAPLVLCKFIRYLMAKGVNTEGIFSQEISHSNKEFQHLKRKIITDKETIRLSNYTKNPHVIAQILKSYLSSLPEPLLTYQFYDSFLLLSTIKYYQDKLIITSSLLGQLPTGFYNTTKQLLYLFNTITKSVNTKMNANSIAEIFCHNFLKANNYVYFRDEDRKNQVETVEFLIQNYDSLFSSNKKLSLSKIQSEHYTKNKSRPPMMHKRPSIRYQDHIYDKNSTKPQIFINLQRQHLENNNNNNNETSNIETKEINNIEEKIIKENHSIDVHNDINDKTISKEEEEYNDKNEENIKIVESPSEIIDSSNENE